MYWLAAAKDANVSRNHLKVSNNGGVLFVFLRSYRKEMIQVQFDLALQYLIHPSFV